MRFSEICLERYGHFEDHRLRFRSGPPDFHIIYGPNEGGKTTSLAAVSDLLFGIPQRSPYNFRFDYPLMRIGAVLEEDGQHLACRRRKTKERSLVDETDQPINEGRLAALLHGLTRETFGSGFSLDQAGLRRGGEAMVKANDDLGQALFAAGSGLTGIAALRAALEQESGAIWGPRASKERTFTIAERQYEESQRHLKDHLLRPREWSDASTNVERRQGELAELRRRQTALAAERQAAERLRRTGPALRLRASLLAEINAGEGTVAFTTLDETRAETALTAQARAVAERDVAARLRDEADTKLSTLVPDIIVDLALEIGRLVEQRGAVTKAAADLDRLAIERETMAERESLMLRWAMDRYRERRQDPLLRRASALFRTLTLDRFAELKVDYDSTTPRLLGLRQDGVTLVPIDGMSEGTTDQLFLALRVAAVEQSIAAGMRVPFLADDLFVNFDDDRAVAGLRVLADLARSTQVLFFTHHAHLCDLARRVVGAEILSEQALA